MYSFFVSGSAVDASGSNGYEFNASSLSTLSIKGDSSGSTQTLQVAAYDGSDWSSWVSFTMTTIANMKPTVSVEVPVLLNGEWIQLTGSRSKDQRWKITYSDGDGDALVKYEINTSSKGHRFWMSRTGGFDAVVGQEVLASDLSSLWVAGYNR